MKKRNGFTLIELLATVIIIAILVGVGTFIYVNFIGEGKNAVVKITKESLANAAVLYIKEFKMEEKYWTEDTETEGSMYACTTVRKLKDIGDLPENIVNAETGEKISDITTIKVIRDINKVIYAEVELNSKECDMEPPKFNITVTGEKIGDWYTGKVDYKIELDAEMWGTSTYEYYYKDEKNNKTSIKKGENAEVYEGTIPETESFKARQICAIGENINDIKSEEYCVELKLDNIDPGTPSLMASDGVASGGWHKDNFDLKVSGGEGPLSGIYYKYGTETNKLENKVEKNTISNISEHGKTYYVKTYSNVNKESGETSYEVKIDKEKPTVAVKVTGNTKKYNNKDWYYDKANTKVEITSTVGISGVKKYEYYITSSKGTKKVIETGTSLKNYSNLLNSIINGSSDYGEKVKICGTVTNNAGVTSDLTCTTINVDFTTPSAPTLVASDGKASGTWHNANFNVKVRGGGSSPSGIYYKYGTSASSINTKVSNNAIAISTSTSTTYSVITCNNLGMCSSASTYVAKLDKDKPQIISFNKSTNDYTITLTLTATFKDSLSGVAKYKISKDSSYTSSGWTTVSNTTSNVTKSYNVTSNGTYYVWVQDAAGNYISKSISGSNIASVATVRDTFYSTARSTITDKIYVSNPLEVKNVTVNTGRATDYYISGNYIYVTVTGGRTYTDSERVETSERAGSYYGDEIMEEECDCYDGGYLSRGWCTDRSYRITGKNWYVCESYGEWNFDGNTETRCDRGFVKGDYWCDSDPQGDSCSRVGSTKTINCYAMCEFEDYRPDCYDVGTGEYECDRGDYLVGSKCYYCDRGDFNRSDKRCYYYEWVDYDYWEYNVTVEYYKR